MFSALLRWHHRVMLVTSWILVLIQSACATSHSSLDTCFNPPAHPPVFTQPHCEHPIRNRSTYPRAPSSTTTPHISPYPRANVQASPPMMELRVITKRLPARSASKKIKLLLASKFGAKILFFVFQLFCIFVSLNLCFSETQLRIPIFVRCLLCTNSALLASFNAIACVNSIIYLRDYDMTFFFSQSQSCAFVLLYILSLRTSLFAVLNVHWMNLTIWSWVHSRLRGMARLVRDKSSSSSPTNKFLSHPQIESARDPPESGRNLPSPHYDDDWWSLLYPEQRHCTFRRSTLSIVLMLICCLVFGHLNHRVTLPGDDGGKQMDDNNTVPITNSSHYYWYFITPNVIIYVIGCLCWIYGISVEHKKTFIMDLGQKETARLLKMMGIGSILSQAIFLPTLLLKTSNSEDASAASSAVEMLRHSTLFIQSVVECMIVGHWLHSRYKNRNGTVSDLSKIGGVDVIKNSANKSGHSTPKRVVQVLRSGLSPSRSLSEKNKVTAIQRIISNEGDGRRWDRSHRVPLSDIPFTDGMRKIQRTLDGRNWRVCMGVKKQLDIISETSVWTTSIKECTETGFSFSSSEGEGSGSFNLLKWNDLAPSNGISCRNIARREMLAQHTNCRNTSQ